MTETQWDALRGFALLLAVAILGGAGYFVGVPVWRRWQNRRALGEASVFAERRDYRSLMIALRRATELAPGDAATWRAALKLLADIGSPETLVARQRISQLAPQDMALRLALAEDALKFGRYDTAEAALAKLRQGARQDIAFHRLAAALAMAMGRSADLEMELKKILAAEPANLDARFTYAALRLWQPDAAANAGGKSDLEKLLLEPSVRVRAAVELLSSLSRIGTREDVHQILVLLLAQFAPNAAPDFSAPAVPAWPELIAGLKAAASSVPSDTALVARWLAIVGQWQQALSWVESLPPVVRESRIVADIEAEISAGRDDLPRLQLLLRAGAWGDWPPAAQALAIAARIQKLRYSAERSGQTWNDAIEACGESLAGLRNLARLSNEWRDNDAEEKVLRRILNGNPKIFWAYGALRNIYLERRDLLPLWWLYDAWRRQLPDDPSIVSTWITLGSILNHADPAMLARSEALRAHFSDSLPAQVANAAVLWRLNRPAEAWALLARLPLSARQRPDISFWVALIQADLGHKAEAAAAMARAKPGATFTEEKALLRQASAKIGSLR